MASIFIIPLDNKESTKRALASERLVSKLRSSSFLSSYVNPATRRVDQTRPTAMHIPSKKQAAKVKAIKIHFVCIISSEPMGEFIHLPRWGNNPNPTQAANIPAPVNIPSMVPKHEDRPTCSLPWRHLNG
jgi:hypothetical protein